MGKINIRFKKDEDKMKEKEIERGEKWPKIEIARDMAVEVIGEVGLKQDLEERLINMISILVDLAYTGGRIDQSVANVKKLETISDKLGAFKDLL